MLGAMGGAKKLLLSSLYPIMVEEYGLNIKIITKHDYINPHRKDGFSGEYCYSSNEIELVNIDQSILKHELGHAIDHLLNDASCTYKIEKYNKTFFEIVMSELKEHYHEALDELLELYRDPIDKRYEGPLFEKIKPFLINHSILYTLDEERKFWHDNSLFLEEVDLFNELNAAGYVENILTAFHEINYTKFAIFHDCFGILSNHNILVDLLSCKFNFKFLSEDYGHGVLYYERDIRNIAHELFAKLFSTYDIKTQDINYKDDLLFKYFPKSIDAFKILCDYMLNNICNKEFVTSLKGKTNDFDYSHIRALFNSITLNKTKSEKRINYLFGYTKMVEEEKYTKFYSLSLKQKKHLYDIIENYIRTRKDDFKFMFGEKLKYEPYLKLQTMASTSLTYQFLFEINKRLRNRLRHIVYLKLAIIKDEVLSAREKNEILNALVFK